MYPARRSQLLGAAFLLLFPVRMSANLSLSVGIIFIIVIIIII
jgi:hypothetical protein